MREVYIYQGNEGEEVPRAVAKLILEEGVKELPEKLCFYRPDLRQVTLANGLIKIGEKTFACCENLVEMKISCSVQVIGEDAFNQCRRLKSVYFENISNTLPHRLEAIGPCAFHECAALESINLPCPFLKAVGENSFNRCRALMEANLSTSGVIEVSENAFMECPLLQTVSLPNTVARICKLAFCHCVDLVTLVVPLDSKPIEVRKTAFHDCRRLSNFWLPKGSTSTATLPLLDCDLLYDCYGSHMLASLAERFENLPIHKMCYDHAGVTVEELRQCIADQVEDTKVVDEFGMTPFHIFFSTIEPSVQLLEVLLEFLPLQILKLKDGNGRRPVDYLIRNWTRGTEILFQRTLEESMIDAVTCWDAPSWMADIQSKLQVIFAEVYMGRRETLCDGLFSAFEHYEKIQTTSMLELALWKWKLKLGRTSEGTNRKALDRDDCRCLSGVDIVIPLVVSMLGL